MAFDVMMPLRDALREISVDNDTRVVVLTGAGHGFCSGADLVGSGTRPEHRRPDLVQHRPARDAGARRRDPDAARACTSRSSAPSTAPAIGGGFCLSLATDIRIAGRVRVLPRGRHQQRPDRQRARAVLPAAAGHRFEPGVRHHAERARRRLSRGRADRPGLALRAPTRSCSTPATTWPSASSASAGPASS